MKHETRWSQTSAIWWILSGLRTEEVAVSWDQRMAGVSKISGTLLGVVRAGAKILWTIARFSFRSPKRHSVKAPLPLSTNLQRSS